MNDDFEDALDRAMDSYTEACQGLSYERVAVELAAANLMIEHLRQAQAVCVRFQLLVGEVTSHTAFTDTGDQIDQIIEDLLTLARAHRNAQEG